MTSRQLRQYFWRKNEFYFTPPPKCCRFFIDNRQCFLREKDNACISPRSKKVIGFWNEKVGIECKLLPLEDETTYEEIHNKAQDDKAQDDKSQDEESILHAVASSLESESTSQESPPPPPPSQRKTNPKSPKSPTPKSPSPKSPKSKNKIYITKPKFVSDAQRARIASEPVALLREKLAKQYGIDGIIKKTKPFPSCFLVCLILLLLPLFLLTIQMCFNAFFALENRIINTFFKISFDCLHTLHEKDFILLLLSDVNSLPYASYVSQ